MICLLCQQPFKIKEKFSALLFLSPLPEGLCATCQASFLPLSEPHCPACYQANQEGLCQDCQGWQKQGYQVNHHSLYAYNEAMREYFMKYKFQGDYLLAKVFARELAQALSAYNDYTFVPIPVSESTYQLRGFNQVSGLLSEAQVPWQDYLRKEEREKQSHLNRQARLQLVQPFSMLPHQTLPEKILLIDDIYTTGSTLRQAQLCLLKAGAKKIKTFSLAR